MSPETTTGADALPPGQLGALVRERRELLGLSMGQLADQARISRSTISRLELGSGIRPMPSKLARVLAILGIDADDIRATTPDDQYRSDLLHWMAATPAATDLAETLNNHQPDLVLIHPDGTVAQVQVKGGDDARLAELADVLKHAGWLVTRPA